MNSAFMLFLLNNANEEGGNLEVFMESPAQYKTDHFLCGLRVNLMEEKSKALHQSFKDELLDNFFFKGELMGEIRDAIAGEIGEEERLFMGEDFIKEAELDELYQLLPSYSNGEGNNINIFYDIIFSLSLPNMSTMFMASFKKIILLGAPASRTRNSRVK